MEILDVTLLIYITATPSAKYIFLGLIKTCLFNGLRILIFFESVMVVFWGARFAARLRESRAFFYQRAKSSPLVVLVGCV